MSATSTETGVKCCGTCKWLDVPANEITKSGRTHKRVDYRMYRCLVAFERPAVPACVRVEWPRDDSRFMCPKYGDQCTFHEARK